jgi:uncharacterized protein (TIGR02145 family)
MKIKKQLFSFFLSFLIPSFLLAQVPQGIPYQAVIRDNAGAPLVNTPILVRFTLHQNTTDGAIEYQETQSATTNAFGVINTQFGTGTPTQGTFAGIVWSNTSKFIQVEANDGNGYLDMGTQQMMSVPYAMYAGSAGNQSFPNGSTNGDMLYWDTNTESWISVPAGVNGQAMYFCDGVPTWGGCVPVLGNVSVSSITPYTAYAEFPMVSNGGSAPTGIGFYLSTQSNVDANNGIYYSGTWPGGGISNWINSNNASVPGGNGTVKSGNDGATSISNLTPNTQYYIIGNVSNAKGISLTPVLSFSTPILVEGCMEEGACNYNPQANYNLGCYYAAYGYLCDGSCAGDIDQDGVCDAFDACSDINACNYNNPGNPGCAFDSDGDNVCDDQDGCLDLTACNWQINTPFISCQYAEMYKTCEGTCINDLDGDNVCDEIDNFICANDIDNDQVCDDIDQCTDVNACNYNQHYLDIYFGVYNCRFDDDNDGVCPVNPNWSVTSDEIQVLDAYNNNFINYYRINFDWCEDMSACNVSGNGSLINTVLHFGDLSPVDAGLLSSWYYSPTFGQMGGDGYLSNSGQINYYLSFAVPYGCAYDQDQDGLCDLADKCHDLTACNYLNTNGEYCFPDTDGDGVCDNLDGCYTPGFCNTMDPTATYCSVQNCFSPEYPNNAAIYDANCVCHPFLPGCTDQNACNYNDYAMPDDGSCTYIGGSCDDGNTNTILDVYDANCQCHGQALLYSQGNGVSDIDGNFYPSIIINGQEWMQANLAVTKFCNGDSINTDLTNSSWNSTFEGAFAYYDNSISNYSTYGNLYNWLAVIDNRGLCPTGWHVPSDSDWSSLINFIDPDAVGGSNYQNLVGGKLKSIGSITEGNGLWEHPNQDATNLFSFSAFPGGYRTLEGNFELLGFNGGWWTSTLRQGNSVWFRQLNYNNSSIYRGYVDGFQHGFSIRCLKD